MTKTKNIIISGTNFWNPGDDFVRDGVIQILRRLFPDHVLNFLFYNFNQDFFPQSKFSGIHNMVAAGDLDKYRDFVDAVVIAGLSAGEEIKDLYNWVIRAGLQDRVYLIGAGYENTYVDKHIRQEPEITIFKNAKIITGRTRKTPPLVNELNLPYRHINCPAILSVPRVKTVEKGRKIEKIAMSIQIPESIGIMNQWCSGSMYDLCIRIFSELYGKYEVDIIGHHKSEYFHFLNLFKHNNIKSPVIFSSYYQDLFDIYANYDLVITTRLHSSLFANGFGIPGIIINDTDRHTHTLEGFPHSVWVNSYENFTREFNRMQMLDLSQLAQEAEIFKSKLMGQYLEALREPFGISVNETPSRPAYESDSATSLRELIYSEASRPDARNEVLQNLRKLESDYWLENNIKLYEELINKPDSEYIDNLLLLNWYARKFQPANYLEIGVRRGRSLVQVLGCSPDTLAIGLDLWIEDYGSIPEKGIFTRNPGPGFVLNELLKFDLRNMPWLIKGDSKVVLPQLTKDPNFPSSFELIMVDGDHSYDGAKSDLEFAFKLLSPGGAVIFDDIEHKSHPELKMLWNEFKAKHRDFIFCDYPYGNGTGIAIKPPFDKYIAGNESAGADRFAFDSELKEQILVRSIIKPGMIIMDVGAHVGKYTRLFSHLTGSNGKVYAFEPTPESFEKLSSEITGHNLNNVELVNKAAYSRPATLEFHEFPEEYSSWNSLGTPMMLDPKDYSKYVPIAKTIKVEAIDLDSFITSSGINTIDYLKLDVEGAEIFALEGMKEALQAGRIKYLQFEISQKMLEGLNTNARNVFDFLRGMGYECHEITDDGKIGQIALDSGDFYNNYIAFPASEEKKKHKISDSQSGTLKIHFFTIVLNGMPFIEYHINIFKQLPFPWHWHIIEGVADLKHDTAWSLQSGGRISSDLHNNGWSNDGTTEYLDNLERQNPGKITIYRQPEGKFWDGKLAMVNAPLENINEECVLWEIDSDELWTAEQILACRQLFASDPQKTAAFFLCHFFVGRELVITSLDTYGNHRSYEWIRVWRFKPGDRWVTHEPPKLCRNVEGKGWTDLAAMNPFSHCETVPAGLIFQHFAYVSEEQLKFKEIYYGYKNAVNQWAGLQRQRTFPLKLRDYFAWVNDEATVNHVGSTGIKPIAIKDMADGWTFLENRFEIEQSSTILFIRTDSIGDIVLASSMLRDLRGKFPKDRINFVCQEHIAELLAYCPYINGTIGYSKNRLYDDINYRNEFIAYLRAYKADMALNSVFSPDESSHFLTVNCGANEIIGIEGDLSNITPEMKRNYQEGYSKLIPVSKDSITELEKHRDFLQGLDINSDSLIPEVWLTAEDQEFASLQISKILSGNNKIIAVFPSAQWSIKLYSRLAEVMEEIHEAVFILLGGPDSVDMCASIETRLQGKCLNLAGKISLRQTAAIIRKSDLFLGVDSVGAHMACAFSIPNVVILGGGHFGRFLPYSPSTTAVCLPLDCYNCNWQCRFEHPHCIGDIEPDTILEAINYSLNNRSSKPVLFIQKSLETNSAGPSWQLPLNLTESGRYQIIYAGEDKISYEMESQLPQTGMPKISVITPSYNQCDYIEQTIQSVLRQNYPHFEHIIVDGGSTDGTIEILKSYPHLIWISEKDNGQTDALNKGLRMATGDIIAWLNSDDFYPDETLPLVAKNFLSSPGEKVIIGDCLFIYEGGEPPLQVRNKEIGFEEIIRYWDDWVPPTQPSIFFKRELLDEFGFFDESLHLAMDYDFWLRIAQKYRFRYIPETLSVYRFHSQSKSGFGSQWERFYPEWNQVYKRYKHNSALLPKGHLLSCIFIISAQDISIDDSITGKASRWIVNFRKSIIRDNQFIIISDHDNIGNLFSQAEESINFRVIKVNTINSDEIKEAVSNFVNDTFIIFPDTGSSLPDKLLINGIDMMLDNPAVGFIPLNQGFSNTKVLDNFHLLNNTIYRPGFIFSDELIFSVIIPTHNRSDILVKCLDALSKQSFPIEKFEVIVSDDGSTDDTKSAADKYDKVLNLKYLRQENLGPGAARNRAIIESKGEFLLIINDDTIPDRNLLAVHYQQQSIHREQKIAVLGSFDYISEALLKPFTFIISRSNTVFDYISMKAGEYYNFKYFWTCNISISRQAVIDAGMFDLSFREPMGEDIELGFRLEKMGFKILYCPDARAIHDHSISVDGYIRRQKMWGRNFLVLAEKHTEIFEKSDEYFALERLNDQTLKKFGEYIEKAKPTIEPIINTLKEFDSTKMDHSGNLELRRGRVNISEIFDETKELLSILHHYLVFEGIFEALQRNPGFRNLWVPESTNQELPAMQDDIIFSVIIPTYNRSAILVKCLDALSKQRFPVEKFEVFVIDDGSTDNTEQIIRSYAAPYKLNYIRQKNSGPGPARNKGILQSKGKYLLILNDDTIASPDLLEMHLRAHNEWRGPQKIAVLGTFDYIAEARRKPFVHFLSVSPMVFAYPVMEEGKLYPYRFFWTCNVSIEREAIIRVGLFDERYTDPMVEDTELGYRLEQMGYYVLYYPQAKSMHDHTMDIHGFAKRQRMSGRNIVKLFDKHPGLLQKEKQLFGFENLGEETLKKFRDFIKTNKETVELITKQFDEVEKLEINDPGNIPLADGKHITAAELVSLMEKAIWPVHFYHFYSGILEEIEKKKTSASAEAAISGQSRGNIPGRPLRVLFTMYGWNESGGGTIIPKSEAVHLVRKGLEVAVFYAGQTHPESRTPYYLQKSSDDGVKLYGVFNRPTDFLDELNPDREIEDIKIVELFRQVLDDFRPDVVHFQNFLGLSFAIAEEVMSRKIPSAFTPHNYHLIDPRLYMFKNDLAIWKNTDFFANSELAVNFPDKKQGYFKRINAARKLLNENIGCTLAISSRVRDIFIDFSANPEKIFIVNQLPDSTVSLSRNSAEKAPGILSLGFIGAVLPHKGVHNIVLAAQNLQRGSVKINIWGFGSQGYIDQMKKLDINGLVNFGGEFSPADLPSIASGLDAMIIPSIWEEGAGMVIPESLAMGLPVIAANIGGIPDYVVDGYNGLLYKYDSVGEISSALASLLADSAKLGRLKKNCNLPYDFDHFINHLIRIYEILASGKSFEAGDFNLLFREKLLVPGKQQMKVK